MVSFWIQMDPVHTTTSYFLTSVLIPSFHIRPALLADLVLRFPDQNYICLISPCILHVPIFCSYWFFIQFFLKLMISRSVFTTYGRTLVRVTSPSQGPHLHRTTQHRETKDKPACLKPKPNPRHGLLAHKSRASDRPATALDLTHFTVLVILEQEYKLWSSLFYTTSCYFFQRRSKHQPQYILFWNSLTVTVNSAHPRETTCRHQILLISVVSICSLCFYVVNQRTKKI
jgi:hypothetical protein